MSKATDLAQRVVAEARERKVTNDYAKMILSTIRSARISLNDTQKAEAEYAYGKNWNRSFFGRVTIANDGIPLDSVWSEWASMYPDVFDADISDADTGQTRSSPPGKPRPHPPGPFRSGYRRCPPEAWSP